MIEGKHMPRYRFADVHCHAHELGSRVSEYAEILLVGVSDDHESSLKTLELAVKHGNLVPALGVHPWSLDEVPVEEAEKVAKLVEKHSEVRILGEVGLDKKFKPHSYDRQVRVFEVFLKLAREYGLMLDLHAAGAWRETYEMVIRYDPPVAVFHWYTGPLDLAEEIAGQGYYISINPAVRIQEKHRRVARLVRLDRLLAESDAPYNYRGIRMEPSMVADVVEIIAEEKGLSPETVREALWGNFARIASRIGLKLGGPG